MITRYSTDVEDFPISVEFGAVGAVGAVNFETLYKNFEIFVIFEKWVKNI